MNFNGAQIMDFKLPMKEYFWNYDGNSTLTLSHSKFKKWSNKTPSVSKKILKEQ